MAMDGNNRQKIKVLFVADKWCGGNRGFGFSEWEGNLWASLKSLEISDVEVFHLDDYFFINGKKGDAALLERIGEFKPDLICLIVYKFLGSDFNVADAATLDKIRDVFRIPMVAIWGDLEIPEQIAISKSLCPYVEFNIATASAAALARINDPEKYIYSWVPKDKDFFYDNEGPREIDVSYVGTPKNDRLARVNYLIDSGQLVIYTGGERQKHLTVKEYADMYRKSKITLSFSRAVYSHVINARPFEAMLCGAMVLEEENFETPKLYTPYVDYVPYFSNKDLLEKARYYLEHDDERRAIARSGYAKTQSLYSAGRFWKLLIDKALHGKDAYDWKNKVPLLADVNLSRVSGWTRFRWKMLDGICSTKIGYFFYYNLTRAVDRGFWIAKILQMMKFALMKILPEETFQKILEKKRKLIKF